MDDIFSENLLPGEKIVWSGKPELGYIFTSGDIALIPFSLLWCGFVIFWEATAITRNAPLGFKVWGIPFVLVGLYMVFGRFFYQQYKKKRTFYAITDQRILIAVKTGLRKISSTFINSIPTVHKEVRVNGVGTLQFGNSGPYEYWNNNTGLELFNRRLYCDVPTFYDIKNANQVYSLVLDIRNKQTG